MAADKMTPNPDVTRALVVTAHPDDVDFGAGATVAGWTKAGIEVAYCVCTGRVTPSIELRRDISRQIRRFRPQRVLTQSPEIWWRRVGASHPDHRAVGEAALAAVYPDARNPFAHPELLAEEGLEAWAVGELWLMAAPEERQNHVVNVTPTLPHKVAALRAHSSQTAHLPDLEERMHAWASGLASEHGLPEGRHAEVFQVVQL